MTKSAYNFIIDAHEDIAWNMVDGGRDPLQSALLTREREKGSNIPAALGNCTTGLPQCLAGRIGIVFSTLFVMPAHRARGRWKEQTNFSNSDQAFQQAMYQLDLYKELADKEQRLQLITTAQELDQVVDSWTTHDAEPSVGFVPLMEGADPVREPAEVELWYEHGLRLIGPAWAANRYTGSNGEPGPLTPLGRQLLDRMADFNMVLDLSHMAEEACLQALDSYDGTIIASHSNPRKFRDTDRNLSDDTIRQLAERGGVVGVVPFNIFLLPEWRIGDSREPVSIQIVADIIDHVAQVTGSSEHVGMGTDFDGGFGCEAIPREMDTIADLGMVAQVLDQRGYSPADIERIMNGNWLRILRSSLP